MFSWFKSAPKTQQAGIYKRANSDGLRHHNQTDPKVVPDFMDVVDQAPHIFTWRMTGPSITIQVLKLRDGQPMDEEVDTYIIGAQ